ncbi:cysteine hydrolase family protein [Sphingomonas sp. CFBP 8760]|uniref:cysteine hydrolase family protein n=1 Tax=Sphingomonas sp. CFBP 8760 TaxID=2775282 RepID=UPI00177E009B|nr:cysteine hydrolase family protein [Sphingomonas sp. CFBP 8760]MBD8548889.1 cysteine hydrolase [Sphingomonas sp. CFBP 8760]
MTKRALIVVDLQNEYEAGGKLPLENLNQAVVNAKRVIASARGAGDTVVHFRHETPDSNDAPFAIGTNGTRIIEAVVPIDGETVMTKHYPNSFRDTGLKALLDEAGVENVVIVGAMSHMCIDATARAAFDFGYGVTVVGDACATMALSHAGVDVPASQVHAAFMAALAFAYGSVVSTADLLPA